MQANRNLIFYQYKSGEIRTLQPCKKIYLNTIFEIGDVKENAADTLFIEMGQTFCSLALINSEARSANFVGAYSFEYIELEESIDHLLKIAANKREVINSLVISPAFPEALLVPNKFYHYKSSLLNNIFNDRHFFSLSDPIAEWQLINVYTLPVDVHKKLTGYFPNASYLHAYTPLLKVYNGFSADYQLSAHFIGKQFRAVVKKNHHIELVQTYSYTSPLDVVYYLLKICSEFDMPQEETQIVISGLIEEDSALYKELHNYFLQLHFATNTTLALPEHKHPAHFFTSIHNLAACVL